MRVAQRGMVASTRKTRGGHAATPKQGSSAAVVSQESSKSRTDRSRPKMKLGSFLLGILRPMLRLTGSALWALLFPLRPLLRPVGHYLVGVRKEFREVIWPKRREAWKLTFAVVAFAFVFVALVQIIDYGLRLLFEKVII